MSWRAAGWRWRALLVASAILATSGVAAASLPGDTVRGPVVHRRFASTSEAAAPKPVDTPVLDAHAALAASPRPVALTVAPGEPLRVAFLGDSVAWSTASALDPLASQHGISVVNAGIWGCGTVRGTPFTYFGSTYDTLPNDCAHWPDHWQRAIDFAEPHVAVVMVGRWELMDRVHDGRWTHVGDPVFDGYLSSEFDLAIATAASRGARVVVATTPYYRRGDAPGGGTWPEDAPHRVDLVNSLLRAAAARHRVGVVDYGALLSPEGRLAMEIDGVRVRTDGVHIAQDSGAWMAPRLLPAIRAAAGV